MIKLEVKINDQGRSILKYLEAILSDVPKNRLEKAFRQKDIVLNGKRIKDKNFILNLGDQIIIYGLQANLKKVSYKPINYQFKVVYEDKHLLVVDKQVNVITNDAPFSLDQQVWNYLKFIQKDSFIPSSIGRLDKVTSGIVVYAKDYLTLKILKEKQKHFKKIYLFKSDLPKPITTNFKLGHDEKLQKQVVMPNGKMTKTIFYFENNQKYAEILTGKKHQIRASLAKLGYPIWGDRKYGGKKAERVYLHALSITFNDLSGFLSYLNGVTIMSSPNW